jgi:hypothetical protein
MMGILMVKKLFLAEKLMSLKEMGINIIPKPGRLKPPPKK